MPYINEENLPYLWERIKQLVAECGCQNCSGGGGGGGGTTDSAITDSEVTASTPIECKTESLSEPLWCGTGTAVAVEGTDGVEVYFGSWGIADAYLAFYGADMKNHLLKAYIYAGTSTDPMYVMSLGRNVYAGTDIEFIGTEFSAPQLTKVGFVVDTTENVYHITLTAPNTVLTVGNSYRLCVRDTGITFDITIS